MLNPTYEHLRSAFRRKGYKFYDEHDYNLNLVGIRAPIREAGAFDDTLAIAFRQAGRPVALSFVCTTDPGKRFLVDPINPAGAAILAPGQYVSMWQIGMHRGRYEALVQRGPCTVFRDNNRDSILDPGPDIQTGLFGINLHRAGPTGRTIDVDDYSAGCQVLQSAEDFALVLALAKLAARYWGARFTYTLLNEADL